MPIGHQMLMIESPLIGYVFKYASESISWKSRKQWTVESSTTEAEHMALSEASKESSVHIFFKKGQGVFVKKGSL